MRKIGLALIILILAAMSISGAAVAQSEKWLGDNEWMGEQWFIGETPCKPLVGTPEEWAKAKLKDGYAVARQIDDLKTKQGYDEYYVVDPHGSHSTPL